MTSPDSVFLAGSSGAAGVVGVDLGGTKTTAALVVPGPQVLFEVTAPTPAQDGSTAVLETVTTLVDQVVRRTVQESRPAPRLVGLGAAGVIDQATGTVLSSTASIVGWAGTPVAQGLAAATGLDVHMLNDVHAHAMGEARFGAGAGKDLVLLISVGTGVGGSFVVDGRVLSGAHGAAGHMGHVSAPEAEGLTCPCGALGHLESIASGPGLVAAYVRLGGSRANRTLDARALVAAGRAGDVLAAEATRLSARSLGRALGGWVNTFDPDVVVLTGGLASAGSTWWSHVLGAAADEYVGALRLCPVVPARLGSRAALVGAASFAVDESRPRPTRPAQTQPFLARTRSATDMTPDGQNRAIMAALEGELVVSCQAYPGEPMRDARTMAQVAAAVVAGGAAAVRVQGLEDIVSTTSSVAVPVIGLWKDGDEPVFITPTLAHARAVRDAGADIIALDGTARPRPDGRTLAQTITALKGEGSTLVMADCATLEDALAAHRAGADLIGTTLAGHTDATSGAAEPDLDLVRALTSALPGVPIIAEGRLHTAAQAAAAMTAGAYAVVVGTAITHPTTITTWFKDAVRSANTDTMEERSWKSS